MKERHDDIRTADRPARAAEMISLRERALRWAWRTLLFVVALGPPVVVLALAVVLPAFRIAGGGPSANQPSTERPPKISRADLQVLRALRSEEAFWKSRLELAKQDAIALAVDLVDSTATLDIRGVPVRVCKIRKIEKSNALRTVENRSGFRERLSKPLAIRRETATLPKEPIRVEIAPKDTTEAAKAATRPLAPEEVDVYFTLFFDDHLAVAVRQAEKPFTKSGHWRKVRMDAAENLAQAGRAFRSLVRAQLPEHELRIELTLSRDDAKAIYRALGAQSRVALRL